MISLFADTDPCVTTGLSSEVNCTSLHQSVHPELSTEQKTVTALSHFRCQRSRYSSLLREVESDDHLCGAMNYEYLLGSQQHPREIHRYVCQDNHCDHNVTVVHNILDAIKFISPMKTWGLKIEPTVTCSELEIPNGNTVENPTRFSALEALQLSFPKLQRCKNLFYQVSSWDMPHLEYFGLDNAFISIGDMKPLLKILEVPVITAVRIKDTVLCHRCYNLFEAFDSRLLTFIDLRWRNYDDEYLQRFSKAFIAKATQLKALRLNVPITEIELANFISDHEELMVGDFTANIESMLHEPSFNLSITASSQIQELYLRFNVGSKFNLGRIVITLHGFDYVGLNLKKVYVYSYHSNQLVISLNETLTDWEIEYNSQDGVTELLCTRSNDLNYF